MTQPKTKTCKHCKTRVVISDGLQTRQGFFCCVSCCSQWAADKHRKAAKKQRRDERKAKKEKAKDNDRKYQLKITQRVFNRLRVLEELQWFAERGLEPTCISCGKPLGGDVWCCGHFKTTGAQSGLRFDKRNTYLQHNFSCNNKLSGDIAGTKNTRGYKAGLLERFGAKEGQVIIDYCERSVETLAMDCAEIKAFRLECYAQIREIEKSLAD